MAGLRQTVTTAVREGPRALRRPHALSPEPRLALLALAALLALLAADLLRHEQGGDGTDLAAVRDAAPAGLRVPAPPPRLAHTAQATLALLLSHLLLTGW